MMMIVIVIAVQLPIKYIKLRIYLKNIGSHPAIKWRSTLIDYYLPFSLNLYLNTMESSFLWPFHKYLSLLCNIVEF